MVLWAVLGEREHVIMALVLSLKREQRKGREKDEGRLAKVTNTLTDSLSQVVTVSGQNSCH